RLAKEKLETGIVPQIRSRPLTDGVGFSAMPAKPSMRARAERIGPMRLKLVLVMVVLASVALAAPHGTLAQPSGKKGVRMDPSVVIDRVAQAKGGKGGKDGDKRGRGSSVRDEWNRAAEMEFARMDVDRDGFLSRDEMPEKLKRDLPRWDRDKDGMIDLDEF